MVIGMRGKDPLKYSSDLYVSSPIGSATSFAARVTAIHSSYGAEISFRKNKVNYYNIRHVSLLPAIYDARLFFKYLSQYLSSQRLISISSVRNLCEKEYWSEVPI